MQLRRYFRRQNLVVAAAGVLLAALLWAWSVITPTIGEPYVAAGRIAPTTDNSSRPALPARLWSFGFVGDTHAGLADGTVDAIFNSFECENLEFVLHLGDMVDVGAADDQWELLVGLAGKHHLRLMPVVGNHDPHRGYPSDRGEIRIRQYFPELPETFYSFHYRGLNFVMLNSERSLVPGSEQATFLARQLAHQPGTTLVCLHRPVFTCGRRDLAFVLGRRLCLHRALCDTGTVCVLTGHNHYYERSYPLDGVTYLVSGGGTANQYTSEKPNTRTARFASGRSHFGLVDVYADYLSVRVVDLEGAEIDAFDLPVRPSISGHKRAASAWGRELKSMADRRDGPTRQEIAVRTADWDALPSNGRTAATKKAAGRDLPAAYQAMKKSKSN